MSRAASPPLDEPFSPSLPDSMNVGSLLTELVPFIVGLAVTPTAIAAGILFLGSRRPVANTSAFAAAFALVYGLLSVIVLLVAGATAKPLISPLAKAVITLCVGAGLLLLAVFSEVRFRRARAPRPSQVLGAVNPASPVGTDTILSRPAAPARRGGLLAAVETATPAKAFTFGLVLAAANPNVPILLAGLAAIVAAPVSVAGRAVAAIVLVAGSELGVAGPLVWYLARPASATRALDRIKGWLNRHQHVMNLTVLVVFGVVFTVKGIAGL